MRINAPRNWQLIDRKDYLKYAVMDLSFMRCECAYLKEYKGQNIVITCYNYGEANEDSFDIISKVQIDANKENYFVDGDPNDPDYDDTSIFSCIFQDKFTLKGYQCFGSVSRMLAPDGNYSYVFQLYLNDNGTLYSVQFRFLFFDEDNIEQSLNEDETFLQVVSSIE